MKKEILQAQMDLTNALESLNKAIGIPSQQKLDDFLEELDIANEDDSDNEDNDGWEYKRVCEADMITFKGWTIMHGNPILLKDLSPSQRLILTIWDQMEEMNKCNHTFSQRQLCELTGFTNKGIRTMLEDMKTKGYVKRGLKAATWELNLHLVERTTWDNIR